MKQDHVKHMFIIGCNTFIKQNMRVLAWGEITQGLLQLCQHKSCPALWPAIAHYTQTSFPDRPETRWNETSAI